MVFDRAEDDHSSTLVVVNPDAGVVHEQPSPTREAIREAEDNERFDTSDDAPCVEAVYLDPDMTDQAYTFPADRLYAPDASEITHGYSPVVWAKATMLADLFETLPIDDITTMDAGLEGQVILCAKEILASRGTDHAVTEDDAYLEERHRCPGCDAKVHVEESIESEGDGVAFCRIACGECSWEAREEWVHRQTKPIAEETESPYSKWGLKP